jgi:WS/DGAT/MGAT family acyltransferase
VRVAAEDSLSALDATFLYAESERTPMHVGALCVFDRLDRPRDELIEHFERRSAREPRLRKRLLSVPGELGRPVLVDDEAWDVERHVHLIGGPPYDHERALRFAEELIKQPMPRDRPLWHVWLFDMTDDRTGLIMCVHHCLADGIAGLQLAMAFLSLEPDEEAPEPAPPPRPRGSTPSTLELIAGAAAGFVADQARLARSTVATVRPGGGAPSAVLSASTIAARWLGARLAQQSRGTLFERVGMSRSFATLALDLGQVKRIKDHFGCKVNDVLLASTTAGVRAALQAQGVPVDAARLTATVPVNVRVGSDQAANAVSRLRVTLPVGVAGPVPRLLTIAKHTATLKGSADVRTVAGLMRLASAAPPPVLYAVSKIVGAQASADLLVTNLAGPPVPLYLLGARLHAIYPFAPLAGTTAVCVAILSYVDGMFVGVSADPRSLPTLDGLVAGMVADVEALDEATR